MTGPEVLNAPEPSGSGGPRSVAVRARSVDGWWVYDNRQTMKEKVKQFVGAKRGVSPVIGVVLMVAVVVILAAVIGAFVLGLGGDQQASRQASFSYDSGTLTMESGDAFGANTAYVKSTGGTNTTIPDGTAAGDTITGITASDGDTIRVIDGKTDSTIWKTTV